jgi:hypothetical protein
MSKRDKVIKKEREKYLSDIKAGNASPLHLYHYGRLLSLGMNERDASDEIFDTAYTIEALIDRGAQFSESKIFDLYNEMPMKIDG